MLKDFWYVFFVVKSDGKNRYFLNYKRANALYNQLEGSKSFGGVHIKKGLENFAANVAFEDRPISVEVEKCKEWFASAEGGFMGIETIEVVTCDICQKHMR